MRADRPTCRCEEIASDVLHVSVPRRRGFVNVQLFVGSEGWTLVDSAEQSDVAREALLGFLGRRGVLADGISQIFLTHGHRDHTGLAGELARLTGATVLAHESTLLGDPVDLEFLGPARFREVGDRSGRDLAGSTRYLPSSSVRSRR